jgi:hypothetical protein
MNRYLTSNTSYNGDFGLYIRSHNDIWRAFFLVSWGGVRLSPLGTSATNWPILPAPDDR